MRELRRNRGDSQQGFSLIEQLMVIAIMVLLLGIATPSLSRMLSRNQLQVAQTDFIHALRHARELAAHSGKKTVFCPSANGRQCSPQSRWERGWLLAHEDADAAQTSHAPLYVGQGYGAALVIQSSNGRRQVRFQPDGSAGGSNLSLVFCEPASPHTALSVVVSNSGRIRGAPASNAQKADCAQWRSLPT